MPTRTDISIWRGNNTPAIVWLLPGPVPDGASYHLTAIAGGRAILELGSEAGALAIGADPARLEWTPTLAQSRAVPAGRVAQYEIEERIGAVEATLFAGSISGLGGVNADAGAPIGATFLDAEDPENISLFLLGWIA
jgi:hypothetical protein